MTRITPFLTFGLLLGLFYAPAALAQPFSISVQQPQGVSEIADNGTITMASDGIGLATFAGVTITNRGAATASFNFITYTGSLDFSLPSTPTLPVNVRPRETISFTVRYVPTVSAKILARVIVSYSTSTRVSANLTINLAGTAPEFTYSYTPQGGNATNLTNGGTIVFPETAIDATSTAVVVLTNRGTAQGAIMGVSLAGADFELVGAPLPDTKVDGGKDFRFAVNFKAKRLERVRGSLAVETLDRKVSFALEGSGKGPLYTYSWIRDSSAVPIQPGQVLTVPDAPVGEKTSIVVRVTNQGNEEGKLTTLSLTGAAFSLLEPPILPLTVPIGGSFVFGVQFLPKEPGRAFARLRIDKDDFDVTAVGLGSTLSYSYLVSGVSSTLVNNGAAVFTPVVVGGSSSLEFQVTNTGTVVTTVASIGFSTASTIFTLTKLPPLPSRLEPGASLSFAASFAPTQVGGASITLRVDTATFILSGTGTTPPDLPPIRFEGATGAVEPLQQPAVGLSIGSAYPLALNGTLTLTFNSEAGVNDPAVQFVTGSRTIAFTIATGSTRALFANNSNTVRIQIGSVAGTITLTPSVSSDNGINLTPTTPPTHNLNVPQQAPRLLGAAISARTANTITLQVGGYSTNRSVTQADLEFAAVAGENLGTQRITLNVEAAFLGWYANPQSIPFGSLFTLTIPLTLEGDLEDATTLTDAIQSITVRVANRIGPSNQITINVK